MSTHNISNAKIGQLKTHRLKIHIRSVPAGGGWLAAVFKGLFSELKTEWIPVVASLIWPRAKLTLAVFAGTFSCRVRYCPSTLQFAVWNKGVENQFPWAVPYAGFNYSGGIFKFLRGPRIDSKEWIPPAFVAWRAGPTTLFLLGS
jgi:hypothetical protein